MASRGPSESTHHIIHEPLSTHRRYYYIPLRFFDEFHIVYYIQNTTPNYYYTII
jgi:hypothetical protein